MKETRNKMKHQENNSGGFSEGKREQGAYEAYLTSVPDLMEAEIIMGLLESEGIPAIRKHQVSGDYMEVLANATVFGVDLYVPPGELERAKALLEAPVEITEEEVFEKGNREIPDGNGKYDASLRRKAMKVMIVVILGVSVVLGLWSVFFAS